VNHVPLVLLLLRVEIHYFILSGLLLLYLLLNELSKLTISSLSFSLPSTSRQLPRLRFYLKPRPHQQQCRSKMLSSMSNAVGLQIERIFRKSQTLLRHCFLFGNNVERDFREISFFQQRRNKVNMFNLFRLCRKDEISRKTRSILLQKGNNVEATFDFRTLSKESFDLYCIRIRQCCWCGRGFRHWRVTNFYYWPTYT